MKLRKLNADHLHTTKYFIYQTQDGNHINIADKMSGSEFLCLNLINRTVEFTSLNQSQTNEIKWIRAILTGLINSGEINEYLVGEDEIENPIKIYQYVICQHVNHILTESSTDHEWLITSDGLLINNFHWFETPEAATEQYIRRQVSHIEELNSDNARMTIAMLNNQKCIESIQLSIRKVSNETE